MKLVFLSNYFNHHQKALSDALTELCDYTFVSTAPMTRERRMLGWDADAEPNYVRSYIREPEWVLEKLQQADVVIAGTAPEKLIHWCIRQKKLVFRYSERPLKRGLEPLKYLPRQLKWHWQNFPGDQIYLLCASAFAAMDYAKFGLFREKAFCWGYFPETKHYESVQELVEGKRRHSILWAGRLLDWKHPEDAVYVAMELKRNGIHFDLNIIGNGEKESALQTMITRENLEDCVHMLGAMKPEEVRCYMEESEIFLFTSDKQEGWGAVLNEAMNSGCAVVASHAIGAVPYLLKDGENALVYTYGNTGELYRKVEYLLKNPVQRKIIGANAVGTILEEWNGEEAAHRLIQLIERLQTGEKTQLYYTGPCSPAMIIREDWYWR